MSILQSLAQQSIDDELINIGMSNGTDSVDAWGSIDQAASPAVPFITGFSGAGAQLDLDSSGFPHRGHEIFFSTIRSGGGSTLERSVLAERLAMMRATRPSLGLGLSTLVQPIGGGQFNVVIRASNAQYLAERTLRFRVEVLSNGSWITYTQGQPTSFFQQQFRTAWLPLSPNLDEANLIGDTFQSGSAFIGCCTQVLSRVRVIQDSSRVTDPAVQSQADAIVVGLAQARTSIRDRLIADLAAPTGDFADASARLADTRALLDGYLTLGASYALGTSEILRAALRGIPGAGGIWLDSPEWIAVINAAGDADTGELGGPDIIDIPSLLSHFDQRVAALGSEIALALDTPAPSFPYVEFMLAELRDLRDNAFDLATDDTYLAPGSISIDAADGLMANDIGQPGRIDNEDLMVDPDFFGSVDHTPPMHGSLSVAPDGSFTYTPDPGFEGTDSFNYRLVAQVGDPDNPVGNPDVYSTPARVVLRVTAAACIADLNADGQLNFFDVSAFLVAYGDEDPLADLNNDGLFNFFDVSAFLVAYSDGCP
ncbi:MAG: Ig-like domain-containing protein [Phycisphaerales bacterium]